MEYGRVVSGDYADMAELADAPDLGSGGRPCRFKSCYPHYLCGRELNFRGIL